MRYYITADDFGLTETKTEAIDIGIRSGYIQRASLIMNMPATEKAIELSRLGGYEDRLCFHLNLAQGFPLTDALRSSEFCSKNGSLRRVNPRKLLKLYFFSAKVRKGLRAECEAQIKAFRDSGLKSTHIDSHTWCLCSIPVWNAIKPLLKKYGFETTRTNEGHLINSCSSSLAVYYKFVFMRIKRVLRVCDDWSGCGQELEDAMRIGSVSTDSIVELYVHPDMKDGEAVDTLYSYARDSKRLSEIVEIANGFGELKDII
ncbi:MAG: ChbG/HpnK family deacetylase [Clostridia bacterium]|nr:ChbG/HpnK family deacetylase [Clostridia bacterium]